MVFRPVIGLDFGVIHCFKGFRGLDLGICGRNIDMRKNFDQTERQKRISGKLPKNGNPASAKSS